MTYSCMEHSRNLTEREERDLTKRLLAAIQERPEDWTLGIFTARDEKTGIEVWTCNGPSFVKIRRPVETSDFCRFYEVRKTRRRFLGVPYTKRTRVTTGQAILDALHEVRHNTVSPTWKRIDALLTPTERVETTPEITATVEQIKAHLPKQVA